MELRSSTNSRQTSPPEKQAELLRTFVEDQASAENPPNKRWKLDDRSKQAVVRPRQLASFRTVDLKYPKSVYKDISSDDNLIFPEHDAIRDLKKEALASSSSKSEPYVAASLELFTIYRSDGESGRAQPLGTSNDFELIGLHLLRTLDRKGGQELLFDGTLTLGNVRCEVRKVPFEELSIEGYGDTEDPNTKIWIRSKLGVEENIWYCLRNPASEYKRYFEPFQWIATFGKHVIDFLSQPGLQAPCLHDFRRNFHNWLRITYESKSLETWLSQYGYRKDFRGPLVVYREYIWKECADVNPELCQTRLFKEISPVKNSPKWTAVPWQQPKELKTIVTPYVYRCFETMYFSSALQMVKPAPTVLEAYRSRLVRLGFVSTSNSQPSNSKVESTPGIQLNRPKPIKVGDVLAIRKETDSKWKDNSNVWFGYVQDEVRLSILWLYAPEHTPLGADDGYPYPNELFLSDHCSCGESITEDEILGTVGVQWSPAHVPTNGIFVRQQYLVDNDEFATLRLSDQRQFRCKCKAQSNLYEQMKADYLPGDTILIQRGANLLKPAVLVAFLDEERKLRVRKLLRRGRDLKCSSARPNELAWTNTPIIIWPTAVKRRCQIRFYTRAEIKANQVPVPYSRDGQVDCWIISTKVIETTTDGKPTVSEADLSQPFPSSMALGFDPHEPLAHQPLRTLSLFSGGGNLDFGLEEGGKAMDVKWHVEWDAHAVHTISANSKHPSSTNIFYGSVDDCMLNALQGTTSAIVPMIGEVEALAGGAPCQAFSMMQTNALSEQSLKNASKVASVASYIDLYRPIYALLENVPSMASRKIKDQSVFQRLLCALVGMGYQVSQHLLEAWTFGAPTKRSRLFIIATAPGFTPPQHPPLTHSKPGRSTVQSLGTLANGDKFGVSREETTPFTIVSAKAATSDLPDIGDGHVGVCIRFPDHRPGLQHRHRVRLMIQSIPIHPPGMGIAQTLIAAQEHRERIPEMVWEYWGNQNSDRLSSNSRSFRRIDGNGLFPTIATKLVPADCHNGYGVHWEQDRTWTVLEARRAQGIPDDFVLVGSPAEQWKLIGNGVARPVSLAIGMSIRKAWLANPADLVSSRRAAGLDVSQQKPQGQRAALANTVHRAPASRASITVPVTKVTDAERALYAALE